MKTNIIVGQKRVFDLGIKFEVLRVGERNILIKELDACQLKRIVSINTIEKCSKVIKD